MKLLVEGNSNLTRDAISRSISIQHSDDERTEYKRKKQQILDIQNLKKDVQEIKMILNKMLGQKWQS